LPTLKPDSQKSLGPIPTFHFQMVLWGKIFWRISSASPNFAPRDGPPVHKELLVLISAQKSTGRIKVQC
jgi:hypothetical protein